jgi:hypothetical protein
MAANQGLLQVEHLLSRSEIQTRCKIQILRSVRFDEEKKKGGLVKGRLFPIAG